jgi:hypothetical protein
MVRKVAVVTAAAWLLAAPLRAQGRAATPAATETAQAMAPVDLTGYWVSVITEDWRWRMVTPAKGDYASVPITPEAKRVADAWDPAKDEAAGEQCRPYGAAGLMRMPTRLHITWLDANTLKVESDAGMQTRLLHFGAWKGGGRPTWQGDSVAEWDAPKSGAADASGPEPFGSLTVVTTNMRPGYLRKNGIPYGPRAKLTEYWDVHHGRTGEQYLVVSTIVEDPTNLQIPWWTSPNFKREPDGSKWDPTPCTERR